MFFKKSEEPSSTNKQVFFTGLIGGIIGGLCTFGVLFALENAKVIPVSSISNSLSENNPFKTPSKSDAKNSFDVSDIVATVNPAVVSIVITKDVPIMQQYFVNPFGQNSPFGNFQIPQFRQKGTQSKEVGGGSGFIISTDGYIVSNAHVVSDSSAQYTVFLNGGKKYDAKVIALDDVLDIALLNIEGQDLPFTKFGDSGVVKLGQSVIAIGNALGEFRNTVSTGVVSGLSRSIQAGNGFSFENLDNLIQTDAAINPGNSCG
ncbi:MAG: trypsin-like peptidase domain-containing protein, partial [Patescibacteria group bacterium]